MAVIREDRNLAFWASVCDVGVDLSFLSSPRVKPLRSDNGGYLLVNLDGLGRVWDLHAAYSAAGRGKEAAKALKAVLRHLGPWHVITVAEVGSNPMSRPPLSYGFRPAGRFSGGFRTWVLTRTAWEQSPASRRSE